MVLKQILDAKLLKKAQDREIFLNKMESILDLAKKENRSFSEKEETEFESLEKKVRELDESLAEHNTDKEDLEKRIEERDARIEASKKTITSQQLKDTKRRSDNPVEIRGFSGKERVGQHNTDVTIGDLVVGYVTGKPRNKEVREAMSTTGSGILVPTEVFENFIDMLRDQNFLSNATIYPMTSKALVIPKVIGDIEANFKAENELIVESAPIFDQVRLEAKPLYAMTSISLELLESSGIDIGAAVTNIMASSMAASIQNFMLHGDVSGLGFEGVLNDPAINTVDADTIDYATIGAGIRAIRNANGVPNGVVINSNDSMNLELMTDTTNQFIQPPKFMENLTMYDVAGAMPEGSAVAFDLRAIAWGILSQGGLQMDIDKSGDAFNRGSVKIRARINSDFALTNPKLVSYLRPTII